MASRSFNLWSCNLNVSGWDIDQCTLITSGPHIITAIVEDGGPTVQVDGENVTANILMVLASPDPIQPGSSPLISFNYENMKHGGDYGTGGWGSPTFIDTGYGYYQTSFVKSGATVSGAYSADYHFDSLQEYQDALENGEITPIADTVYFDVYINGSDQPNIWVNWTAGEALSPAELTPKLWEAVDSILSPEAWETLQDGIMQPNTSLWNIGRPGDYSYGGSYESSYMTLYEGFESFLNPANKIIYWGIDGIPNHVYLYLRMDSEINGIGDLYRVSIAKDGTPMATKIEDSSTTTAFTTVVRFHTGEPDYVMPDDPDGYPGNTNYDDDGPGRYDPDDIPDPSDFTDPVGFDGNAVLTKTYAVSEATLRNIGQKLWSQSYFNVLKIQNNPIENIVAVKHYPFSQSVGTAEDIKVGDIDFGIQGLNVPSVKHIHIGSYIYTGYYNNFLDLAPYTKTKLNLPYIGLIELDPADIYGSKLSVDYYIDLVTGQCMAKLELDSTNQKGIPYMTLFGQIGVDIPLTSSDRVQTELRAASAAVTAMGGSVGQMISGNVGGGMVSGLSDALNIAGADYTSQRTSSQSPACGSYACQDVFLLIERPTSYRTGQTESGRMESEGYKHLHGIPYHKYKTLSTFAGGSFVQIDRRTDIAFGMTAEENKMLEQLLTTGVYI